MCSNWVSSLKQERGFKAPKLPLRWHKFSLSIRSSKPLFFDVMQLQTFSNLSLLSIYHINYVQTIDSSSGLKHQGENSGENRHLMNREREQIYIPLSPVSNSRTNSNHGKEFPQKSQDVKNNGACSGISPLRLYNEQQSHIKGPPPSTASSPPSLSTGELHRWEFQCNLKGEQDWKNLGEWGGAHREGKNRRKSDAKSEKDKWLRVLKSSNRKDQYPF